jgi:hypothetical protein
MLQCYFLCTTTDVIKIYKEMYKTHVTQHNFLLSRKSNKITFFGRNVPYLRFNGSAAFTSYCNLKCNENVTNYYKK